MSESTSQNTRFEKLIAFLIASVAILVAITLSLQNYASSVSAKANRAAQELAIGSTTTEIRGAIQFSYDWQGAFQTWNEIHLQQVAADQTGNTKFVDRYTKLEEKFVPLTPLLS